MCLLSGVFLTTAVTVASPLHDETLDTILHINQVEVTAQRPHQRLATVQTLQGDRLQSLSSTSIADALKYFSGVQIKDYGGLGGLKTVNVRSLGAQHVGVYIDGIKINNAQNGTVDLGKYSLSTLESVSLYNAHKLGRTQSASEYASGATIYLQTRRPASDSTSVTVAAGSFNTYKGKLTTQLSRRRWSGFIDGEYVYTKGNYPFRYKSEYEDTVGRRRNSDIEFFRTEAAFFSRGFSSHFYVYSSERGCPGGIVRRLSDKYTNIGREWDTDIFVQGSWEHEIANSHFLRFNVKYSHEYLRYKTDYPENQNTARVDNHYRQNDAFASAAYTWQFNNLLYINTGYDARMSWLKADLRNFLPVRRLDQKAVLAANIRWKGFRGAANVLYQHYRDRTTLSTGAARPISRFTPSISVGYMAGDITLRGWYKQIFRVPTLNDLYYTQAGNRNLKPEMTRQWNIGLEYHFARGGWQANAQIDTYVNHIDNRIVCLPLRGTYTWTMLNYGKTYCRGLNGSFSAIWSRGFWMVSLLYTLTWQRDLNRSDPEDSDTYDKQICYSPDFSCGATVVIAWKKISLTISELHVASRMWSYADPEDILKPYDNIDAKLTASFRRLTASLEINDLLDIQYEHIPRYPMPGRAFNFSLTYSF